MAEAGVLGDSMAAVAGDFMATPRFTAVADTTRRAPIVAPTATTADMDMAGGEATAGEAHTLMVGVAGRDDIGAGATRGMAGDGVSALHGRTGVGATPIRLMATARAPIPMIARRGIPARTTTTMLHRRIRRIPRRDHRAIPLNRGGLRHREG